MRINNSRIAAWLSCRMKYYWMAVRKIVPKRTAMPLYIGRIVHQGLAAYYKFEKHLGKAQSVVATEAEREVDAMKLFPGEEQEYLDKISLSQNLITHYDEAFRNEELEMIHPEVAFRVRLGDSKHEMMGRADGVAIWQKSLWNVEHKTAGNYGKFSFTKFALDPQVSTYIYGVSQKLKIKIKGAIVNILVKSMASRGAYRDYIPRTATHMAKWLKDTIAHVNEIEYATKHNEFPMNTNACTQYGLCQYHKLCSAIVNKENVEMLIESNYVPKEDDYVDTGEIETVGREKV